MKPVAWGRSVVLVVLVVALGCVPPEEKTKPKGDDKKGPEPQVKVEDLKVGTGEPAKEGDFVVFHYTGWLTDDTKFDSSLDRQEEVEFRLGSSGVIKGWEKGLIGMKAGGKRRLTIPPELGYGKGSGPGGTLPPNSTLIFEIDLLRIKR